MSRQSPELTAASVAPVFAALGDPTRLSLLSRLCRGQECSIAQLTEDTTLTRQGVTKHLAVLKRAKIVSSRRVGRESRYAVRAGALSEASAYLHRASRQWDDAIARLRQLVEK
jgi:DNA-binding transcriptional ArsR family regulator